MRTSERRSLIESSPRRAERDVFANFVRFSVAFSLNHAVVVTALSLSATELGLSLGSYGNGALYIAYTLAALLLSTGVVAAWGAKRSVVVSLGLYCVYVVCYLGAIVARSHQSAGDAGSMDFVLAWALVLVGACLGGDGARGRAALRSVYWHWYWDWDWDWDWYHEGKGTGTVGGGGRGAFLLVRHQVLARLPARAAMPAHGRGVAR